MEMGPRSFVRFYFYLYEWVCVYVSTCCGEGACMCVQVPACVCSCLQGLRESGGLPGPGVIGGFESLGMGSGN